MECSSKACFFNNMKVMLQFEKGNDLAINEYVAMGYMMQENL